METMQEEVSVDPPKPMKMFLYAAGGAIVGSAIGILLALVI